LACQNNRGLTQGSSGWTEQKKDARAGVGKDKSETKTKQRYGLKGGGGRKIRNRKQKRSQCKRGESPRGCRSKAKLSKTCAGGLVFTTGEDTTPNEHGRRKARGSEKKNRARGRAIVVKIRDGRGRGGREEGYPQKCEITGGEKGTTNPKTAKKN